MHARWKGAGIVGVAVAGLAALSLGPTADAAPQPIKYSQLTKTQKRLVSGFASTAIDSARGALPAAKAAARARTLKAASGRSGAPFYYPNAATGCAYRFG